jgi:hypothetical protein
MVIDSLRKMKHALKESKIYCTVLVYIILQTNTIQCQRNQIVKSGKTIKSLQ